MTYTIADMEGLAALAGNDMSWNGSRGGHRPTGKGGFRAILRNDLAARQGFVCTHCGDDLDESPVFAHHVARGADKRGWFPRNISITHSACNDCRDANLSRTCDASTPCHFHIGSIVPPTAMARPDLVPDEWTPFPILKRQHGI